MPKIDVMYLYTEGGKKILGGISDTQMRTMIATALATTNEAMANSQIDLKISPVYIGLVRGLNSSDPSRFSGSRAQISRSYFTCIIITNHESLVGAIIH